MLKFNPDIIHFHMPLTLGMEAILTAKILEKPLIATFHTFFMEEEYLKKARINNKHAEKVFSKIGWEYSKLYYNQSDIIITPSKYTAANIQENGCTKPVAIIPNSIEISPGRNPLSPAEREKLRIKFGIPPGNKVIIWLGRLSPEKKIDVALAAVKILLKRTSKVTFLLIGDGPQRAHLEKIAAMEILKKNVIFTGTIEHNLLIAQRLLAVGDVFLSASTSETQCISAIEAMAEGLPLAVVDKRGLPELVDGNGFICTAGNPQDIAGKLYTILTDEKLRHKMSAKSRELSINYSNEIIAKKLTELYEKVISSRQDPNTNNLKSAVLPG